MSIQDAKLPKEHIPLVEIMKKPANMKVAGFCVLRKEKDKWSYNEAVNRKVL